MSLAGTVYVWDGAAWVLTVGSGEGGGGVPPGGPEGGGYGDEPEQINKFLFTGGTTTGWDVIETWSNIADYQRAVGSGSGFTIMEHAMDGATVYAETDVYMNHTGTEWVALKINHPNGSAISASDGDGILMRGNGEILIPWSGGSDASLGAGHLSGNAPQTTTDRVALGIHDVGGGIIQAYVNRVLRRTYTGCTNRTGDQIAIGVWNGGDGRFHQVREYSDLPF
jgi:hypothetical protein